MCAVGRRAAGQGRCRWYLLLALLCCAAHGARAPGGLPAHRLRLALRCAARRVLRCLPQGPALGLGGFEGGAADGDPLCTLGQGGLGDMGFLSDLGGPQPKADPDDFLDLFLKDTLAGEL